MPQQDSSWWDSFSDQPYQLDAEDKPRFTADSMREYAALAGNALLLLPLFVWRLATIKPPIKKPDPEEFVGLSVSPNEQYDNAIVEMVAELGVKQLLVRVPSWDLDQLEVIQRFIERFPAHEFLINVLQDPRSVRDLEQWRQRLEQIFAALGDRCQYFQVGNAINRSKWGCRHSGEYLALLQVAEEVRRQFPGIKLVGSSVIDFEPLVTFRTLYNNSNFHLDVVSSLLYVNRRGSPYTRQFGIWHLAGKIRLLYTLVTMGNRNDKRFWITEMNWPLLDTKPYTPNSGHPRSTVDEPTQARYLKEYFQIAYASGYVERVYWWQLINPGYGLVDHRGGALRKHPSYEAFKDVVVSLGKK